MKNSKDKTPEDSFLQIADACVELGWLIAMNEGEDGNINGVIIGTEQFVAEAVEELGGDDVYDIYQHGFAKSDEVH